MEDVIQVKNRFYVLATSSLADDRTRVLKYGETFAVFNRLGDIEGRGLGEQGLYHRGTRYLSRLTLRMGDSVPQLLRSTIQDDNAFFTLDMMNSDVYTDGNIVLPRGALHLFRSKFLWEDTCYEKVRLSNFSLETVETFVSLRFETDFVDIFQVRGIKREVAGDLFAPVVKDDSVSLSYQGRDGELRRTRLEFSPAPAAVTNNTATFAVTLEPKQEVSLAITTICERQDFHRHVFSFDHAMAEALRCLEKTKSRFCGIGSSNQSFNRWLSRSEADVHMMISGNPEGDYPYAGVPWFSTVFGRDAIVTALECLWAAPWIAKSVLQYLAENQATAVVSEEEAEPGKILHEMRHGEMANLKEVPFGRYYGSVDATPLFVMLAGAYFEHADDLAFLEYIWPNLLAALDWVDTYGDPDGDGFTEYLPKNQKGLTQQGWKDSYDSVFLRDGSLALAPVALCEVQAYVFRAKQAVSKMAAQRGQVELSARLSLQAETLRRNFERDFWDDDLNAYVLALDAEKRPCRVLASNAGHCLFTGIASPERAERLVKSLLGPDIYCGWGIRSLGSREVRYNPMAYHNGSVWPHDNAIIARGFARYHYKQEASQIFSDLFDASTFMELNRLPELFCGFHRRSDAEGPTLYPVACSPQAWSAAAAYLLLEACLGIEISGHEKSIQFSSPLLPPGIDEIKLTNITAGEGTADLLLRRVGTEVSLDIMRAEGKIDVRLRR